MHITCCSKTLIYSAPVTVAQIARDVDERSFADVLCGMVDGQCVDLDYVVSSDASVQLLTLDTPEGKTVYNRTCAYVMAQAVKSLYPTVKLANGPADENGFCYDFDFVSQPTRGVLAQIEQEMQRIIEADLPYKRVEMTRTKAIKLMSGFEETYKIETVGNMPKGTKVSVYYQGDFANVCRGPMLASTGALRAFKLLSMSTAYWQGDKNNKKLRRIYGVGFASEQEKTAYLAELKGTKGTVKGVFSHSATAKKLAKNS